MGNATERQTIKTAGKYRLDGRFVPGPGWMDGFGEVWSSDAQGDVDWKSLGWSAMSLDESTWFEGRLQVSGRAFAEWLARWGTDWHADLSPRMALLARAARLSAAIAAKKDVIAFAAPASTEFQVVFQACLELAQATEDGLGRWGSSPEPFAAAWLPAWSEPSLQALHRVYADLAIQRELRFEEDIAVEPWIWICVDTFVRQWIAAPQQLENTAEPSASYRIMYRGEAQVLERWQQALRGADPVFAADGWLVWRTLRQTFAGSGWTQEGLCDRTGRGQYHVEFELLPPAPESVLPDWRLVFYIAHDLWSARAPLEEWWKLPTRTWCIGKSVLENPDEWFLPKLRDAAAISPAIERAMNMERPAQAALSPEEVFAFLTDEVPLLEQEGFLVRYPKLDDSAAGDVRIRVRVKRVKGRLRGTVAFQGSRWFETDQLVDFDWSIAVGDTELTREAFEHMVEQRTPFVQLGGSWRLIPVQDILNRLEELRGSSRSGTRGNLMQLTRALLMDGDAEESDIGLDVSFAEEAMDIRQVMGTLIQAHQPPLLDPPAGFHGTLRGYQQFGYAWLAHLRTIGCGGVLADDMGLGKTVQILAYLLYLKETNQTRGPHLLVCPTSLLQNWKAELARFAPGLKLYIHHGAARNVERNGENSLDWARSRYDIIVTTYATVVRDAALLTEREWDVLIADEAQNIKNYATKQAQSLRRLEAVQRVALTGTPIENRLEELWSIFHLTNSGYLGSLNWFRKTFVDPITRSSQSKAARRLHQLLRPVLLRRSKTDPAIQTELPEKWEVREYAGLTTEQAALYQSIVNRLFNDIGQTQGMSRRGHILTALVRLKQICDHPCLAMGGSSDVARSGKLKLLLDLLEGVLSEGESALIFTQFRDMGELLCNAIAQRFEHRPKFLHGGLSATQRGDIVDAFQTGQDPSPILVLSLKAGGVGINLTRANHVFHFDRWWNPAVEDQATDRAFRIGQVRDVQVHKLVCPGTLEERIDALILSKRALSSAVVGESEGWITEMDNEALRALFALDAEAAVEEDD